MLVLACVINLGIETNLKCCVNVHYSEFGGLGSSSIHKTGKHHSLITTIYFPKAATIIQHLTSFSVMMKRMQGATSRS